MARITISDLYRGEGPGEKYGGILNAVMQEVFTNGIPEGCEEITWLELLTVKHTFLIAKQMAEQGDVVSELTDAAPPCSIEGEEEQPCSGAQCAPRFPAAAPEEVTK
jgi:hypothetical protein